MLKKASVISSLLVGAWLSLASLPATAQYTGPNTSQVETNLSNILKNPVDDQHVQLEGYLVRKLGKERYLFSDGKNEIRVDIDDDDLPQKEFNEKSKVIIYGEVEKKRKGVKIDVDRIVLKQ